MKESLERISQEGEADLAPKKENLQLVSKVKWMLRYLGEQVSPYTFIDVANGSRISDT